MKLLQMYSVEQLLTRHGQKTAEGPGNGLSVSVLKGFWLPAQGSCPKMPDVLHSQGLQCKHCSVPQGRVVCLLFKKNRRPRGAEQTLAVCPPSTVVPLELGAE